MHLVEAMLQGTPGRVKQRLAEAGADIAIIGRRQVLVCRCSQRGRIRVWLLAIACSSIYCALTAKSSQRSS